MSISPHICRARELLTLSAALGISLWLLPASNVLACCTVGDGELNHDNMVIHYLLRTASRNRLFTKYRLRDDIKFYSKSSLLFAEMEKQSLVGVISWRSLVSELRGRKDLVVIGVVEDKFPYVIVHFQQNAILRNALSSGVVVQGERTPAHLAAVALLGELGLEGVKPTTTKDPAGVDSWLKQKRLPVLVPVEALPSVRMQGWYEVGPLAKTSVIFPQTIVVTSRAWVERDRANLANFMVLLNEAMTPNTLLTGESVSWGFESIGRQFVRSREDFREVIERRLVDGGRRPPGTDSMIVRSGLRLETEWYPYLRDVDPRRLIEPNL